MVFRYFKRPSPYQGLLWFKYREQLHVLKQLPSPLQSQQSSIPLDKASPAYFVVLELSTYDEFSKRVQYMQWYCCGDGAVQGWKWVGRKFSRGSLDAHNSKVGNMDAACFKLMVVYQQGSTSLKLICGLTSMWETREEPQRVRAAICWWPWSSWRLSSLRSFDIVVVQRHQSRHSVIVQSSTNWCSGDE